MKEQKVIISHQLENALSSAVEACERDRLFILVDGTTQHYCLPLISGMDCMHGAKVISIGATDEHKTLQTLTDVWTALQQGGATRHSLMINLGGGMVTDLGGFAAATFKRGMNYINIPTTLLAMVDASVGGKTGINFGGLKNEVGVFSNASSVIIDTVFLKTLDRENLLSGYAEMLKHGLISDEQHWVEVLNYLERLDSLERLDNLDRLDSLDNRGRLENLGGLASLVADSVAVKQRIVREDPTEKGLRKALNLGHTVGHAFESLALQRQPILHGYAVAYGLICELYLSTIKTGFPVDKMRQMVNIIRENYGQMTITCDDYPTLLGMMTHDKKNVAGEMNFTLLGGIGDIRINQTATKEEIMEALDFYREG